MNYDANMEHEGSWSLGVISRYANGDTTAAGNLRIAGN